jgi:hypothetical protein
MGPVIGFVLDGPGLELVYISGDNASLDVVRTIADRIGPIDLAVLFAGAVQLAHRFDSAYLTLSSDFAAEAATSEGGHTSHRASRRSAPRSPAAASPTASRSPSAAGRSPSIPKTGCHTTGPDGRPDTTTR